MTTAHGILLCLIPAGYLVGSIPFGYLVGRALGVDVRKAGSGNIGATNVGRLLGRKWFVAVFLLDMLKGLLPVAAAGIVLHGSQHHAGERAIRTVEPIGQLGYLLWLSVGFAAILGHMFSVFLRFKGGKGVSTSAGVVLGIFPYFTLPVLLAALVWGLLLRLTGYMSVASLLATLTLPLSYLAIGLAADWHVFGEQLPLLVFALLISAMIVLKHRGNLVRLHAGTEPRFYRRAHKNGDGVPDMDEIMGVNQAHGSDDTSSTRQKPT